jgi:hypothetical protein
VLVFNVVGGGACLYSSSFSVVLCFFCSVFAIVHFYVLYSGLIVATNTCSSACVEDVHYIDCEKETPHLRAIPYHLHFNVLLLVLYDSAPALSSLLWFAFFCIIGWIGFMQFRLHLYNSLSTTIFALFFVFFIDLFHIASGRACLQFLFSGCFVLLK